MTCRYDANRSDWVETVFVPVDADQGVMFDWLVHDPNTDGYCAWPFRLSPVKEDGEFHVEPIAGWDVSFTDPDTALLFKMRFL